MKRWSLVVLLACACASCGYDSHDPRSAANGRPRVLTGEAAGATAEGAAGGPSTGRARIGSMTTASDEAGSAGSVADAANRPNADRDSATTVASGGSSNPRPNGDDSGPSASGTNAAAGASAPPPEVWIGELWTLEPMLCEPDDFSLPSAARSGSIGHSPEGRTERVVLLIDRDSDPTAPTGRLHVGDAKQPTAPSPEPNDPMKDLAATGGFAPNDSPYWCATSNLADGGEYSLLESLRTTTRLQFSVAPIDLWRAWCASKGFMAQPCRGPGGCGIGVTLCPCGADACQPHVSWRITFDFTIDGDTMETTVQQYGTAQLRLRRVQ